jgi:transcriptional regulator with XRE-family HTH domain
VISEVISGKRQPSKTQVKKLAEFFAVTPDFFKPARLDQKDIASGL